MRGYYGHFIFLSTLHRQENLFCQTILQNGFNFTNTAAAGVATAAVGTLPNAP
jgi:hypothetical protein